MPLAKNILSVFLFLFASHLGSRAGDSLEIKFNKTRFIQGDSVVIDAWLNNYTKATNAVTLRLWIENTITHQQWKYRYPMINGYCNIQLKIDPKIPAGGYAFNFLLQKKFFSAHGVAINPRKDETSLNYMVFTKRKETLIETCPLYTDGNFYIPRIIFPDTAFIVFSHSIKKKGGNDLLIELETPLDSVFTPDLVQTTMIRVGNEMPVDTMQKNISYGFDLTKFNDPRMMKEVLIKSKFKKPVERFEEEYVSSQFRGADDITLDGLSSDEIAESTDLYMYLSGRIGGLKYNTNGENGFPYLSWRNQPATIYVNEFKYDTEQPLDVNPADIAMIKVFRPGSATTLVNNGGGVIAIYTKQGEYAPLVSRKYKFYIMGYNGLSGDWR